MSKEWLKHIKISQELKDKIYYDEKEDLWVISWNAVGPYLTAPTADEVCEKLSDELGEPVYFNGNKFYTFNNHVNLNNISKKNLSLIGRFYEVFGK